MCLYVYIYLYIYIFIYIYGSIFGSSLHWNFILSAVGFLASPVENIPSSLTSETFLKFDFLPGQLNSPSLRTETSCFIDLKHQFTCKVLPSYQKNFSKQILNLGKPFITSFRTTTGMNDRRNMLERLYIYHSQIFVLMRTLSIFFSVNAF